MRVLGRIPSPPPNTEVASRYSEELYGVVVWLLTQDRVKRPTISHVQDRVEALLVQRGGIRGRSTEAMGEGGEEDNSFDPLFGTRESV